jgi:hypothetical protein
MNCKVILTKTFSNYFLNFVAIAVMTVILVGCGPQIVKMSPIRNDALLSQSENALILFSLRMEHPVRPTTQLELEAIYLFTEPEGKRIFCPVDKDARIDGPDGADYLLRIPLTAGRYNLRFAQIYNGNFLVTGRGFMPILGDFEVQPGTVIYLGRVEGRTRERQEGEFRAGPMAPLIDQAARGWSGATWDVVIKDAGDSDLPNFRTTFPALNRTNIVKQILPPFDRQKAQAIWEKSVNGFWTH